MARRTKLITIDDPDSRDNGKEYLITEMDADAGEWWAFRALQLILGADEKDVGFDGTFAQLAKQSLVALTRCDPLRAKPLLEEMMLCVKMKLPKSSDTRELLPNDIEEVKTRIKLRQEIFELHVGFFGVGGA